MYRKEYTAWKYSQLLGNKELFASWWTEKKINFNQKNLGLESSFANTLSKGTLPHQILIWNFAIRVIIYSLSSCED